MSIVLYPQQQKRKKLKKRKLKTTASKHTKSDKRIYYAISPNEPDSYAASDTASDSDNEQSLPLIDELAQTNLKDSIHTAELSDSGDEVHLILTPDPNQLDSKSHIHTQQRQNTQQQHTHVLTHVHSHTYTHTQPQSIHIDVAILASAVTKSRSSSFHNLYMKTSDHKHTVKEHSVSLYPSLKQLGQRMESFSSDSAARHIHTHTHISQHKKQYRPHNNKHKTDIYTSKFSDANEPVIIINKKVPLIYDPPHPLVYAEPDPDIYTNHMSKKRASLYTNALAPQRSDIYSNPHEARRTDLYNRKTKAMDVYKPSKIDVYKSQYSQN